MDNADPSPCWRSAAAGERMTRPPVSSILAEGGVAVIAIDNPPSNTLSEAVRAALWAAMDAAEKDPAVTAIVLRGAGRTWPVGTDLRELGATGAGSALTDLCNRVEDCTKPVIAALHGKALGGGLELALAAHRRIAETGTVLGFPELAFGLLPGGGGTQRAPRLIGADHALDLMLTGKSVPATHALRIGLIDALAEGEVDDDACQLARSLSRDLSARAVGGFHAGDPDRGVRDSAAYLDAIEKARIRLAFDSLPAHARIVDCVEAALILPRAAGQEFERAAYLDVVTTPEAVALRHGFLAERRAARAPDQANAMPRRILRAGVIGGGGEGAAIASLLIGAGIAVTMLETDTAQLARGLRRIALAHERAVERGRLTPEARDVEWARLAGTTDPSGLSGVDIVFETWRKPLAEKAVLFTALEDVLHPEAILATTDPHVPLSALAQASERPSQTIGLRLHMPALTNRLVEVAAGPATSRDVVATGFALARRLGKVAVLSGRGGDLIGERMMAAYRLAAETIVLQGASPYQVDAAMRLYGFALGPFQTLDIDGLDRVPDYMRPDGGTGTVEPTLRDLLVRRGRLGRRSGQGYYSYTEQARRGKRDDAVLDLIAAERQRRGIVARRFNSEDIERRCLAAMANEGVRLLEQGIALRPSDVDAVMLLGYGFPRWRGGPMLCADQRGALIMRNDLRSFAEQDAWFWAPRPLWFELIKNGRRFEDQNRP